MSKVSNDTVLKLARLARLTLSQNEIATFSREFNAILDYVEQLQDADTDGLKPTYQVTGLTNVARFDTEIDYGATPDELLKNVPETKDHYIKVKRMLG